MSLSKKAIDEFKEIFQQEYGVKLSDSEAYESANNLIGFFKVLIECDQEEKRRFARLKKEPKGFYLESGSHYNCLICYRHIEGSEAWWDKYGHRCKYCQLNISKKVISPKIVKDKSIWATEQQIKDTLGVSWQKVRKFEKEGLLKGRKLINSQGSHYFTVYMKSENYEQVAKLAKDIKKEAIK